MPAAVDRVRVLEFSRDVRENLERLRGFVGFPVERFDRARDFETRTVAAAYLRQALEGILAIGRHILARRFRVPATEYKLSAAGLVPPEPLPGPDSSGPSEAREPPVPCRRAKPKPAPRRRKNRDRSHPFRTATDRERLRSRSPTHLTLAISKPNRVVASLVRPGGRSGTPSADVSDVELASSWRNPPLATERGAALPRRLDAALNRLDFHARDVG